MIKNSVINLIGNILKTFISFFSIPILVSHIGLEMYGVWVWIYSLVAIIQLLEAGFSTTTIHFLSKTHKKEEQSYTIDQGNTLLILQISILLLAILAAIFLYAIAPYCVSVLKTRLNKVAITNTLQISSILVGIRLLQISSWGILLAKQNYLVYNIFNNAQLLFTQLGLIIIAIYFNNNILLYFTYWTITIAILILSILLYINKDTLSTIKHATHNGIKSKYKEILKYSLNAWGATISNVIFSQGDKLIIGNIINVSFIGIYSAITSICQQINSLSSQAIHPLFPLLSSYNSSNKDRENIKNIKNAITLSIKTNVFISLIIGGSIIGLSDIIIKLIFPNNYHVNYVYYLKILAIIYTIYSLNATGYYILLGMSKSYSLMKISIAASTITLLFIYIGSVFYGEIGSVIGNLAYCLTILMIKRGLILFNFSRRHLLKLYLAPTLLFLSYLLLLAASNNYIIQYLLLLLFLVSIVSWIVSGIGIKTIVNRYRNIISNSRTGIML